MATVRGLTLGETKLLRSVFSENINYRQTKVFGDKWQFFQPDDTAMTPNGNIYFPPAHYVPDFSGPTLPLGTRAWFVHEGAHLYQFYGLKWNVIIRGVLSRNYHYKLVKGRAFKDYGLEEMGSIAADYYTLTQGGLTGNRYQLGDFVGVLPLK